jgi:hypothetical protein
MLHEHEVRARYQAYEQEVQTLEAEMQRLQVRVRLGSDHWRADLEQLAERAKRRRELDAQRQALLWVLTPTSGESEPPSSRA